MKKVKEILKNGSVRLSAQMLCASASMFALMMCQGKLYEPKMPEGLKR
jgi:cyclic lactone autoinducer peptide